MLFYGLPPSPRNPETTRAPERKAPRRKCRTGVPPCPRPIARATRRRIAPPCFGGAGADAGRATQKIPGLERGGGPGTVPCGPAGEGAGPGNPAQHRRVTGAGNGRKRRVGGGGANYGPRALRVRGEAGAERPPRREHTTRRPGGPRTFKGVLTFMSGPRARRDGGGWAVPCWEGGPANALDERPRGPRKLI